MSGRTRAYVRAYNADLMSRLRTQLQGFSETQLQRVALRARVALFRRVQPIAKKDIRARYGVAPSALNDKFRTVDGVARGGDPYIGIQASARRISLLEFGGRWRGRKSTGATAAVKAGERKTYDSAFIATIKGRRAIRVRSFVTPGGPKRYGRAPLRMLRGPSPLEMLLGEDMRNGPAVAGQLLDVFQNEIARQVDLLRKKANG